MLVVGGLEVALIDVAVIRVKLATIERACLYCLSPPPSSPDQLQARHPPAYASTRQHTPAYVSIRQHTSAYASIRQHTSAYVSIRQHTSTYVSWIRSKPVAHRLLILVTCSRIRRRGRRLFVLASIALLFSCREKCAPAHDLICSTCTALASYAAYAQL